MSMWVYLVLMLSSISIAFGAIEKEMQVSVADGKTMGIRAVYYKNQWGGNEIRMESSLFPSSGGRANSLFGYGRDLNDDGKVETWFLVEMLGGVKLVQAPCEDSLCIATLQYKVFKNYKKSKKMVFYAAYATVVGYLFMSVDNRYEKELDFYQQWVDLEEFRIRINREMNSPSPALSKEQIRASLQMLTAGYQHIGEMIKKANGEDVWKYLGADVALWVTGSALVKLLSKPLMAIGRKISESYIATELKIFMQKFSEAQIKVVNTTIQSLEKLHLKAPAAVVAGSAPIKWTHRLVRQGLKGGIYALRLRWIMLQKASPITRKLAIALKNGASEWKYVGLSAGIQVASETYARHDDVYDEDPSVMAKNVLSNPEVQQNVSYMAAETFLMTSAVSTLTTTRSRYAVCGLIAMTNSLGFNMFFKDDVSYERVALDTSWEMLVGSTQVQIDVAALNFFEKLSQKNGNPKLKLLGYAVAFSDQAVGYFTYSKLTSKVEERNQEQNEIQINEEVKLIPVFAEAS